MIYLDNNATTQPLPEVAKRHSELLGESLGNAAAASSVGRRSRALLDESRVRYAGELGDDHAVHFTAGGTEANLLAVVGAVRQSDTRISQVIINGLEHASVYGFGAMELGCPVVECRLASNGLPDLGHLEKLVTERPSLVSMMHANNETGALFPVEEAYQITERAGGILHVDAAQTFARTDLRTALASVHLVTFSAHKFHGLLGVGGILRRRDIKLATAFPGGAQEVVRSGTVNVPAIVASAEALADRTRRLSAFAQLAPLRDQLETAALERFPAGVVVGAATPRLPNTSCVCFVGVENDELVAHMSDAGVHVGTGTACGSGTLSGSRVLKKLGLNALQRMGQMRISLSRQQAGADDVLDAFLPALDSGLAAMLDRGVGGT